MEIITGGELFDRICEKEKYSEREARVLMFQLASGLAFAHGKGVVHRDLKPENILLRGKDDDTSIKLADLGFAKVITSPTQLMSTPCGTPGCVRSGQRARRLSPRADAPLLSLFSRSYVAPEVISGSKYTLACDMWSMGVIFYILLCGYSPFDAGDGDQAALFAQIKAGQYKFDPSHWGVISDGAKDLVKKILVVDPSKRLTSAQVLAHPWMKMEASALPNVPLSSAQAQMKRMLARRRLKAAMNNVRSIVRMKMLMAARTTIAAKNAGASVDEQEAIFLATAALPLVAKQAKDLPSAPMSLGVPHGDATHSRVNGVAGVKVDVRSTPRQGSSLRA
jgi:serine/threonine protein kinase